MKPVAALLLVLVAACGGSPEPASAPAPAPKAPVMEAPKKPAVMEAPKSATPELLVHLKFGDGAADAAGKGHAGVVQGKVAWGAGKVGKAASFDGTGGHIELPSKPELDKVNEGSYALAAWFKPADVPAGKEADNNANYGIINKTGWHEGIRYGNDKKFVFEHWLAGPKPEEPEWKGAGTWENEYEPGHWYHVVGVVDRAAGATKIYVNGELQNTGDWDANAKARDYGNATWKIGMAAPGSEHWAWSAKGLIDDVRIYKKALTDAEVQALYKEGAK
jgi:concanavalin A-like lectin/glucanase superfamily protein